MGFCLQLQSAEKCVAPIRTDGGFLFHRVDGDGSFVVFLNRYGLGLALAGLALGGGDAVAEAVGAVESRDEHQQYAECDPATGSGRKPHLMVTAWLVITRRMALPTVRTINPQP